MAEAVKEQSDALKEMHPASSLLGSGENAADNVATVVGVAETIPLPWDSLVAKIEVFTKIMDKVSEV
jgi:hypothetical protein